jgi:hypothetical protein
MRQPHEGQPNVGCATRERGPHPTPQALASANRVRQHAPSTHFASRLPRIVRFCNEIRRGPSTRACLAKKPQLARGKMGRLLGLAKNSLQKHPIRGNEGHAALQDCARDCGHHPAPAPHHLMAAPPSSRHCGANLKVQKSRSQTLKLNFKVKVELY